MNITITKNLKQFRKDKGNTQEDLAKHLGISVQAVSKWERGEGYPDITLLPAVALFYGKTTDELLGCGEIEKLNRIEQYFEKYNQNANDGKIEDNIILMRDALAEFPCDLKIKAALMHSLFFIDNGNNEYLDEGIAIGEEILQNSTDDEQRYSTLLSLAYSYNQKKQYDKAKETANKLPDMHCNRDTVLQAILKGEELRKISQGVIGNSIENINMAAIWMLRSKEYTSNEKIFVYETVLKLYNLFLYDKNYGYTHCSLHMLYMDIASEYAKLGDESNTINAINEAYKHAVAMDDFKEGRYTSIFADSSEYKKEGFTKNFTKTYKHWLKERITKEEFAFLKQNKQYEQMLSLL